MRVQYDVMVQEFTRVLEKRGFNHEDAENAAVIFAQNSLAGVFSHGLNRFPRVVSYLEKGEIDPNAKATCEMQMGAIERWDDADSDHAQCHDVRLESNGSCL